MRLPETRTKLHTCTGQPISCVDDWRKLRPLPLDTDVFQEQFKAIELIRKEVNDSPLIMTVFTPLDIADKLLDRNTDLLAEHIAQDPESVRHGLSVFAESLAPFVRKLTTLGIDGIYFSSKWVNGKITADQYRDLAMPFDLQMIREADSLWCNLFHLCEGGIDLGLVADYPVQVFHWDANADNNPGYGAGQRRVPTAAVGGGVDARTLTDGTPEQVEEMAKNWIKDTNGRRFVLGPGCSIVTARTPKENLMAMKAASEKMA